MINEQVGLTTTYNRIHDQKNESSQVESLRNRLIDIDNCTMEAFGWSDIELAHNFYEIGYLSPTDCVRFTISEVARNEILRRLAALNRQRYQEEVDQGLHGDVKATKKKKKSAPRKKSFPITPGPTLDLEPSAPATTPKLSKVEKPEPPIERLYNWLYNQNGKWVPKNQAASAIGIAPEELEKAVSSLVADDDLIVRGEGEETLLKVKG